MAASRVVRVRDLNAWFDRPGHREDAVGTHWVHIGTDIHDDGGCCCAVGHGVDGVDDDASDVGAAGPVWGQRSSLHPTPRPTLRLGQGSVLVST